VSVKDIFMPWGNVLQKLFAGSAHPNSLYQFGYNVLNTATQFNTLSNEEKKLAAVLSNPAALKVFALQCDLFSMGKLYVYDKNEKPIENDPFLSMIKRPNYFQNEADFLWNYMFWLMLGTDYCYVDSKNVSDTNVIYHLNPAKMEWPVELEKWKDKLILSEKTVKDIGKIKITYRYDDGSTDRIPLEKIIISTDLTNGLGNWFKGPSRIDALYKVISNSEFLLDSENINIRYSGKFLVGASNTTSLLGMGDEEKKDLMSKIDTNEQQVHPFKVPVDIKRFVENFSQLQLPETYAHQYFLIGGMFNIPRDVLEAFNTSSTFENQEKARGAHVNYCFDPKGNQFMDAFENYFGYNKLGKNIYLDWTHLPFMQVFEKQKAEVEQIKINSLTSLLNLGIDIKQANEYLDLDFKIKKPKQNEQENRPEETQEEPTGQEENIEE